VEGGGFGVASLRTKKPHGIKQGRRPDLGKKGWEEVEAHHKMLHTYKKITQENRSFGGGCSQQLTRSNQTRGGLPQNRTHTTTEKEGTHKEGELVAKGKGWNSTVEGGYGVGEGIRGKSHAEMDVRKCVMSKNRRRF